MVNENTNVDLDSKNKDGLTPLHMWDQCASIENGQMSFNFINPKDFTRNYNVVKCLLQLGANCNCKDNNGLTVLNQVFGTCLNPVLNMLEEQKISLV